MTSEQLTTLLLLLEQNPQLNDLIPEADPDIDIKRVGPMLERINTLDKFIDGKEN